MWTFTFCGSGPNHLQVLACRLSELSTMRTHTAPVMWPFCTSSTQADHLDTGRREQENWWSREVLREKEKEKEGSISVGNTVRDKTMENRVLLLTWEISLQFRFFEDNVNKVSPIKWGNNKAITISHFYYIIINNMWPCGDIQTSCSYWKPRIHLHLRAYRIYILHCMAVGEIKDRLSRDCT